MHHVGNPDQIRISDALSYFKYRDELIAEARSQRPAGHGQP